MSPEHAATSASATRSTYFIDPGMGCDAHGGVERGDPWRSFAPLNARRLGPGDRVEVLRPGSFEQGLLIRGHGTAERPITVHFAPGHYAIYPTQAETRRYHISNANDGADGEKASALMIEHASHVVVSGPDARIVCRGKMIELCIDHSEHVHVSDLQFDYHRPTVSEFRVVAANEAYAELAIHPDSAYRVAEGRIVWQGEGWCYDTGLAQELIPETDEVWRRQDPLAGLAIEELAPFRIRAWGRHDMVVGRVFQLRDPFRDGVGVFVRRSSGIALRDVDLLFMHGMGVLCQFSADITLDRVAIAPEQARGRTTAAWADCTHFSGCRGRIVIRDCTFCGAHDDAVNIHGTHLRIVGQPSGHQIKVCFMHRQSYGFMAFNPGDEIEFVRWDSLAPFGSNAVTAVELLDPKELLLTLAGPVPDWHADDVIENVTWTPSAEISGCTAMRIPTRGFLITTRRKVEVRNNTFVRLRNGIHIESDAEGWFESGCVRDMTIRGNRFLECTKAAIRISPHNRTPNDAVHRNITITENEFVLVGSGPAVEATGVAGLTVTDNRLLADARGEAEELLVASGCRDVTMTHNTVCSAHPDMPTAESASPLIMIGLVTDLHYAPSPLGNRYCNESLAKLQQSVATFRERKPDVVVCLGDVIDQSDTIEEEVRRVREVRKALAGVPVDTHYLLGNHDVSELTKEQFLGACGGVSSYYSFDCRGVHIVILDSNFNSDGTPFSAGNFHWADAWVGEEQIAWLEADLAAAGEVPTLLFCHANLDHRVRPDGSINRHIVRDAAAVRAVLEAAGSVKAVIQGHDHSGCHSTINGIPYIVLRAMVEGGGLEQNAYALLSLMQDGEIVLEGFGRQSSARFAAGRLY